MFCLRTEQAPTGATGPDLNWFDDMHGKMDIDESDDEGTSTCYTVHSGMSGLMLMGIMASVAAPFQQMSSSGLSPTPPVVDGMGNELPCSPLEVEQSPAKITSAKQPQKSQNKRRETGVDVPEKVMNKQPVTNIDVTQNVASKGSDRVK